MQITVLKINGQINIPDRIIMIWIVVIKPANSLNNLKKRALRCSWKETWLHLRLNENRSRQGIERQAGSEGVAGLLHACG
jgi:hypothetical protein